MAKIEVIFDMEKETPRTVRFLERGGKHSQIVRRVYVQKANLARIGSPRSIRLTIEAA